MEELEIYQSIPPRGLWEICNGAAGAGRPGLHGLSAMKGNDRISSMLSAPEMPHVGATLASVLFLAWPAIIEQIMLTLVQYVDTAWWAPLAPRLRPRWG